MTTIERSIELDVPASVAYACWTQFERFPHFMEGVEYVRQIDDRHLRWRADVFGVTEEWDAEITEQILDKRIAWKSVNGTPNSGVVTFHRLSDEHSRVMLQMIYEPAGVGQRIGDLLGLLGRRIEGDLKRFKTFVEKRGEAIDGWRGEVSAKDDEAQAARP